MQDFIDAVAACKPEEADQVWRLLVDFAAARGFNNLVYGVKSAGGASEPMAAYECTNPAWLEAFVSEAQYNNCYISIKALTATSPFKSGLDYIPEPWASTKAYTDVAAFAAKHGMKRSLAVPLTINSSPTGGSGVAFHTDLPKEQFEDNIKKYQHELLAAALFANDWLKPWVSQKLTPFKFKDFTPRQSQVFALLVQGMTNKEIAHRLDISAPTVSFHIKDIMMRLGAANSREVISKAVALGLIAQS